MSPRLLARDKLWDLALEQHGFVTIRQANDAGVTSPAVRMLVRRGSLVKRAHGVYRFVKYPSGMHDEQMLAVLWTGTEEAALSHESALHLYSVLDPAPRRVHVTIAGRRRLRRAGGDAYVVHYEDLDPSHVTRRCGIPVVACAVAIKQCIEAGSTTESLRGVIERARAGEHLTYLEADELEDHLSKRHGQGPREMRTTSH